MKPVVILDSNALYGRKPFSRSDSLVLFALAAKGQVRLVLPEVVLLELSRQWFQEIEDLSAKIDTEIKTYGETLDTLDVARPIVDLPRTSRTDLYDSARRHLEDKNVEVPPYPGVVVADLLERDLDARKPFTKDGKGFRDALIWETVKTLCAELDDRGTLVIFVTANHKDFCAHEGGGLHGDLEVELPADQRFEIVKRLPELLKHDEISPLVEALRVEESINPRQLAKPVNHALAELEGRDLEQDFGVYEGDGIYTSPIQTDLVEVCFNWIHPDNTSISHKVFRTGEAGELTLRVTVDAEAQIDGLIGKADFLMNSESFSYHEDWNRHMYRVIEPHQVRFTLTANLPSEKGIEGIALRVEGVEEFTPES
ncbi:DUF4935 domain-containing protein [Plantibacter flavus]|uniref:PIN domain-containing protein n=1 Tax=Plantibacter flavus TaxID=150123 RepID=UPI003F15FE0E